MLKDQLKEDMKAALKAGDSQRRTTLSMLLSVIKNRELDKRSKLSKAGMGEMDLEAQSQLTDEEVIETLSTEIKKRKESIATYESAGRPELAQSEKDELALITKYMPEQLSEGAIRDQVKQTLADMGNPDMKEMGKIIGQVMAKVKGKADGTVVSKIVKEELSK